MQDARKDVKTCCLNDHLVGHKQLCSVIAMHRCHSDETAIRVVKCLEDLKRMYNVF